MPDIINLINFVMTGDNVFINCLKMKRLSICFLLLSMLPSMYAHDIAAIGDTEAANDVGIKPLTAKDCMDRIVRYDRLNKLFDSSLMKYGISDISSIPDVRTWDFDGFAEYIIQEEDDIIERDSKTCIKDDSEKTITIRLSDDDRKSVALPASELMIRFKDSSEDNSRTLSLTYMMPVNKENIEMLYTECRDLLADTLLLEPISAFSYEGPYNHVYSLGQNEKTLLFTCDIPVPPLLWYNIPAGYHPYMSYKDLPSQAPCNQGKESFNEFLKKFNKDVAFRLKRRESSDRSNYADSSAGHLMGTQYGFNEFVLTALDESGLLPLHGHYSNKEYKGEGAETEEKESCGQWFYPTSNSVIYSGWNIDTGTSEEDCSIMILFERIDDEWTVTATWYTGMRFNNIVRKLMQQKGIG